MQELENKKETNREVSSHWKKEYSMVVVANILYVVLFYFLMKIYS
jgi:hypothetical protein